MLVSRIPSTHQSKLPTSGGSGGKLPVPSRSTSIPAPPQKHTASEPKILPQPQTPRPTSGLATPKSRLPPPGSFPHATKPTLASSAKVTTSKLPQSRLVSTKPAAAAAAATARSSSPQIQRRRGATAVGGSVETAPQKQQQQQQQEPPLQRSQTGGPTAPSDPRHHRDVLVEPAQLLRSGRQPSAQREMYNAIQRVHEQRWAARGEEERQRLDVRMGQMRGKYPEYFGFVCVRCETGCAWSR